MDEEIKQIEKLLDEEKYEEARQTAEGLIHSDYCNSPRKLLAVQTSLLWATHCLGKLDEALAIGGVAVQLAVDLQEWDYYGVAAHFLGVTYHFLKQYPQAIRQYQDYIDHAQAYSWASRFKALVWYNLGIAYALVGQNDKVIDPLQHALEVAEATGRERTAHGIRQALAEQYLRFADYETVPRLLSKCGKYLRQHPDAFDYKRSRMFHLQLRVKLAAQTGRHYRARVLATRGILESETDFFLRRTFHIFLALEDLKMGLPSDALKQAIAAQIYSGYVNRKDWEEEAADLIREISSALGIPVPDVSEYYLDMVRFEEE